MSFLEIFIIAIGLSMDAFAVAICKGIKMRPFNAKQGLIVALAFGGAQALMPLIGWFIGSQFAQYVSSVDHWITFILLGIIGGKMIKESFEKEENCDCNNSKLNLKELTALAIATSIDALAGGIALAMDARCYNGGTGRTKMKPLRYKSSDVMAYVIIALYLVVVIVAPRYIMF